MPIGNKIASPADEKVAPLHAQSPLCIEGMVAYRAADMLTIFVVVKVNVSGIDVIGL